MSATVNRVLIILLVFLLLFDAVLFFYYVQKNNQFITKDPSFIFKNGEIKILPGAIEGNYTTSGVVWG